MRTITIKLYNIDELSKDAQQKAYQNYCQSGVLDYQYTTEMINSLKAFCKLFNIDLLNWSLSSQNCDIRYRLQFDNEDVENLSGIRLAKYIWNNYRNNLFTYKTEWYTDKIKNTVSDRSKKMIYKYQLQRNNCPFTGVCYDDDLLDPLYKHLSTYDKNVTFADLLGDCIQSFETSCHNELEYLESFDYFIEMARSNEWEYSKYGVIH